MYFFCLFFSYFFLFFSFFFFFFNDTATTEIYTLSLHDALPISYPAVGQFWKYKPDEYMKRPLYRDRKSTRLNSSHMSISYAVFCLKKKKKKKKNTYNINIKIKKQHE